MNSSGELTLAEIGKKIDEQARFTRSVLIICTLAILGFLAYTLTEIFSTMPQAIILQYMANLDKIVVEWDKIESSNGIHSKVNQKKRAATPAVVEPAATTATDATSGADSTTATTTSTSH